MQILGARIQIACQSNALTGVNLCFRNSRIGKHAQWRTSAISPGFGIRLCVVITIAGGCGESSSVGKTPNGLVRLLFLCLCGYKASPKAVSVKTFGLRSCS